MHSRELVREAMGEADGLALHLAQLPAHEYVSEAVKIQLQRLTDAALAISHKLQTAAKEMERRI